MSNTLWARFGKRVFDLVVGGALVILLSLPLAFIGVLVKLSSRGPVFFAQDRAGKDGVIFRPLKFRTMRADRRPDPKELVPLGHSDITPLGWFLRRFK
ncbi:MAG: sugar transferase, partial [Planctomycetota bacterium]